jgi:hypothetical protein
MNPNLKRPSISHPNGSTSTLQILLRLIWEIHIYRIRRSRAVERSPASHPWPLWDLLHPLEPGRLRKEDFITQLRIVLRILQAHPVVRALPPPTAEDTRLVHIHTPRALLLLQAQVDTPPVHIRILLAPRLLQAQLVEVRAPTQDTPPAHIRILPAPPLLQTQLAFRRDLRPFMEGNPLALRILMLTPLVPRLLQIRLVFRWGTLMELTRLLPILTRREQLMEPLPAVFRLDPLPPTEAPIRMHIPTPLQQPQNPPATTADPPGLWSVGSTTTPANTENSTDYYGDGNPDSSNYNG